MKCYNITKTWYWFKLYYDKSFGKLKFQKFINSIQPFEKFLYRSISIFYTKWSFFKTSLSMNSLARKSLFQNSVSSNVGQKLKNILDFSITKFSQNCLTTRVCKILEILSVLLVNLQRKYFHLVHIFLYSD